MNIFVLDTDPVQAARDHCNKHVVKMVIETAQLLSTTYRHFVPSTALDIYKASHFNHPCNRWLRQSRGNYIWTLELGLELCAEYTRRYGRTHASQRVITALSRVPKMPSSGVTPFAQAMPDEYKDENAVVAYRDYYHGEKARFAVWPSAPTWWML